MLSKTAGIKLWVGGEGGKTVQLYNCKTDDPPIPVTWK